MAYDATVSPLPMAALLDLKGDPAAILPRLADLGLATAHAGRMTRSGALALLHPGRQHWLLLAPLAREDELLSALQPDAQQPDALVLAVSDAYAFFSITGPDADQILAIACPLDVDRSRFPDDGAVFTEVFGQKALLMRRGAGFELAVERSYAPMMRDYFSRINPGRTVPADGGPEPAH